jgi:biotin operon repressor
MPASTDLSTRLTDALRQLGGAASSAELQTRLGVSQATVSRALSGLLRAGTVLKVGAARSQHYLLPRPIDGVGAEVPIMRVDVHGQVSPFGRMVALQGGRFWVDEADGVTELHDGLPWFLSDMRPQGFMGRTFVQAHPELNLPVDLRYWSDDDALRALVQMGDDLPGNLIVGQPALDRYLRQVPPQADVAQPDLDYPRLADLVMQGTQAGSSAGGEQPKFCARLDEPAHQRPVLVKFSPAGDAPADQRTRDLLVCEHLALQTLADAGLPAAQTRIVAAGGRVFLESTRFDRTAQGRLGMVSLLVYDAQYVGQMDNWAATAQRMAARQLVTAQDAGHLKLLDAYGQLIGNTDRHYGNISFLLHKDDWQLSPTYDMLPMLYAPIHGEVVARDFAARPLHPSASTLAVWPQAKALAAQFWQTAATDGRISEGFRALALANVAVVQSA